MTILGCVSWGRRLAEMSKVHVIHENAEWVVPLEAALEEEGIPYECWFLDEGTVDLAATPPEGVFYNRMSASAHTRGHRFGPELAHVTLNWLERHGRRVVNSSRALYLEVSKAAQYAALERAGIRVPRSIAAVGADQVVAAARAFGETPFILKPNRGGRGAGVQLFETVEALEAFVRSPACEPPVDGVWLVQEYVRPAAPFITRCELVGGAFLYAVRVDASQGFDLCPADVCQVEGPEAGAPPSRFTIIDGFEHPIVARYRSFLADNGIEVAGIEFIENAAGEIVTYDVNTNTNYNAEAEAAAGLYGMRALARFLGETLAHERKRSAA